MSDKLRRRFFGDSQREIIHSSLVPLLKFREFGYGGFMKIIIRIGLVLSALHSPAFANVNAIFRGKELRPVEKIRDEQSAMIVDKLILRGATPLNFDDGISNGKLVHGKTELFRVIHFDVQTKSHIFRPDTFDIKYCETGEFEGFEPCEERLIRGCQYRENSRGEVLINLKTCREET